MSYTKWSEWHERIAVTHGGDSHPLEYRPIERIEVDGKVYVAQPGLEMAMFDEQSGAVYEGVNRGQTRSSGHVYPMQSEAEAGCRNAIRAAIERDGGGRDTPEPGTAIAVAGSHQTGGISERTWMAGMVANGVFGQMLSHANYGSDTVPTPEEFAIDVVGYSDAVLAELADTGDAGAVERGDNK